MRRLSRPATLLILDGWNRGEPSETNASYLAETPNLDALFERYPHCLIKTSGHDVGLPEGQMGNSEVGHNALGAGRVFDQGAKLVNKAIAEGSIFRGEAWKEIAAQLGVSVATVEKDWQAARAWLRSQLDRGQHGA